jgi:hypothetical protein
MIDELNHEDEDDMKHKEEEKKLKRQRKVNLIKIKKKPDTRCTRFANTL